MAHPIGTWIESAMLPMRCVFMLLVVLILGTTPAFAQRTACVSIQPGETAALLAARLTGNARHLSAPWFQIVDPAGSRLVAKTQYDRILPGWRACVGQAPAMMAPRQWPDAADAVGDAMRALIALGSRGLDSTFGLWVLLVVGITLIVRMDEYATERHATLAAMTRFGEAFVREFERPLLPQDRAERPIQSRLRPSPGRQRLEILLAPDGGRRYPNLSDHQKNVEYDIARVMGALGQQSLACGRPYAQGPWVVVPFQFRINPKQAGGR